MVWGWAGAWLIAACLHGEALAVGSEVAACEDVDGDACRPHLGPSMLQRTAGHPAQRLRAAEDEQAPSADELTWHEELSRQMETERQMMGHKMVMREAEMSLRHVSPAAGRSNLMTELPFTLPFDARQYDGNINASSVSNGVTAGAIAFYRHDSQHVYLGLAANAGFIGFGLNVRGPAMRHADIVVCREDASGVVSVVDYHALENAAPELDTVQDWALTMGGGSATASGRVIWCEISRPRKTCNADEDVQLEDLAASVYGLLAWSDPANAGAGFSYHGPTQRRVTTFSLAPVSQPVQLQPDAQTMRLEAPSVHVSSAPGSYVCSLHRLPLEAGKKFHAVHYRLVYDSASQAFSNGLQHHVDMVKCTRQIPGVNDGQIFPCEAFMAVCPEFMLSGPQMYSPEGETLPADTGIPIGREAIWVVIQRHFYNPTRKSGVADWGTHFDITYTKTLREKELRLLVVSTSQLRIPPATYGHITRSYCPARCTQRLGGETEVKSVTFHMHGHGVRGLLRIVRDGKELAPLSVLDPWDQAEATETVKRTIQPGDMLLLECHYDNDLDTEITYGEDIRQEMCVAQLQLAGSGDLTQCVDMPRGLVGHSPPSSCYDPSGRLWPVEGCDFSLPRTFCPDSANPAGSNNAAPVTKEGRDLQFIPYQPRKPNCSQGGGGGAVPAVPGRCPSGAPSLAQRSSFTAHSLPAGDRTDESKDSLVVRAAADPAVIVGEKTCGLGTLEFKVSWATNCATRRVTFEIESYAADGWLALGLIDAGNATHPKRPPATKMRHADIVQVSISPALKDAWGVGYTTPGVKSQQVAQVEAVSQANGKTVAQFSRPFVSPGGVTLREDGFLYMLCAVRSTSQSFDAKHTSAHANPVPFSLFGGTPGSAHGGGTGSSPAPEPEPEAEPEPEPESKPEPEPEPEPESACPVCMSPTVLQPNVQAGSNKGRPYSCGEAQAWLDGDGSHTPCNHARSWWSATCCSTPTPQTAHPTPAPTPQPTPAPTPSPHTCPLCSPAGDLRPGKRAGRSGGRPYTCQVAEEWLNSGETWTPCSVGRWWWRKCCRD